MVGAMTSRTFVATRIDDYVTAKLEHSLRKRGFTEEVIPYIGYGVADHVRVFGRVVLRPGKKLPTALEAFAETFLSQRGWRNFVAAPVPRAKVLVKVDGREVEITADRGGCIDVTLRTENLEPGWRYITLRTKDSPSVQAAVLVVPEDERFGLISDIDDTIISTWLPRAFLAAWNSFVLTEGNRVAVPGMARLYQQFLQLHPNAPVIYISTGSWTTVPFLKRFMQRHGFPIGPMLLTDFGPTQNSWFRNGQMHKRRALAEIARDFPNITWLLVGDNGQHDPVIYREFSELRPDKVRAIAIRNLTSAEQILAHGTATVLPNNAELIWQPPTAPEVDGDDGDELAEKIWPLLETAD